MVVTLLLAMAGKFIDIGFWLGRLAFRIEYGHKYVPGDMMDGDVEIPGDNADSMQRLIAWSELRDKNQAELEEILERKVN